jgi:hypothetical protein
MEQFIDAWVDHEIVQKGRQSSGVVRYSVIMELNEPLSLALLNSKAVVMPMRT